jgi:hypothetical protein
MDQLIAEAPDVPAPKFEYYHTFPKVKFKTYTLLNCKEALRKFKKKRMYNARKPTRRPNTRVVGHGIYYSTPYIPRRVTKLPEYLYNEHYYGAYFDGFYTNNSILIKMDRPKTKKPLEEGNDAKRGFLKNLAGEALLHVDVKEETYKGQLPEVRFAGKGMEMFIDGTLLDVVYKYHPEHIARTDGEIIGFYTNDELVAVIAALKK